MAALWYFAHPYWGDEERNFELCCQRASKLIDHGYMIFAPVCHSHPIHKVKWQPRTTWMSLCQVMFQQCRWAGLILAPDWITSQGCQTERLWFAWRPLPILDYEDALERGPV